MTGDPQIVRRAAREAYHAGLSIVPVADDGTKRPKLGAWGELRDTRATREQAAAMFPLMDGPLGLGVLACDRGINWDFDCAETHAAFLEAAHATGLGPLVDRIAAGYCDRTPSGGTRWIVRTDESIPRQKHNLKLARRPTREDERRDEHDKVRVLIELPDHAIVAPSHGGVHPSGKPYVRVSGSFATLATVTVEEQLSLERLARTFDRMPTERPRASDPAPANGSRPGDDYNRLIRWSQVLDPHGYHAVYTRGDVTHWRRPGKAEGTSATTNVGGSDLLYVFSSSTPFEADRSYTKFAAYAVLNHGGDYTTAARTLAAQGYGEPHSPDAGRAEARRDQGQTSSTLPDHGAGVAGTNGRVSQPAHPQPTFPLTDSGNGEYVAHHHGNDLRYDHRRGHWLVWRGHHFERDADAHVRRIVRQAMRQRLLDATALEDEDKRKKAAAWALSSESHAKLDAAICEAASVVPIADAGASWDLDPWLLGVHNGVLDLHTGQLRPGQRTDRITMQAAVTFDAAAQCPRWHTFVEEILGADPQLVEFVQRSVGYSLTGLTVEQCWYLLHGSGSNGKSTFLKVLSTLLGDYSHNMPFSTVERQQRSSIPNDIAALVNRRFVVASETNSGTRLNEARLKALTGDDALTGRFLHGEFFTFEPCSKLWLSTNHKPVVDDDSHAFWRRLRLIPFEQTFDLDTTLSDTLKAEMPGILNWALAGCLKWQQDGLQPPLAVLNATQAYEDESEGLQDFLHDTCRLVQVPETVTSFDTAYATRAADLFAAYTRWADRLQMTRGDRLKVTGFGRKLGKRFRKDKDIFGHYYFGVVIRHD